MASSCLDSVGRYGWDTVHAVLRMVRFLVLMDPAPLDYLGTESTVFVHAKKAGVVCKVREESVWSGIGLYGLRSIET